MESAFPFSLWTPLTKVSTSFLMPAFYLVCAL
jgi:hypothetical protein